MQPDDKRAKLQKATLPRCRMLLKAYLPFLPGFPVPARKADDGIPWFSVAEQKEILLTPELIRLANFGWNELHKFPLVFPQAVADVDAWRLSVPWILERLGTAVYGKSRLPDSFFALNTGPAALFSTTDRRHAVVLEKLHPKLKPLLDAVSWLTVLEPNQLPAMLQWIETEREKIVNILDQWPLVEAIPLVLRLFRLVERDGTNRLASLLETLGTKNARTVATTYESFRRGWNKILTDIAQRTRTPKSFNHPRKEFAEESPQRPAADWADTVRDFTRRIAVMPTKLRRLALELFAEYIPPNLLERWRVWWQEMEPHIKAADKLLLRVRQGTYEDNEKRSRQAKELQRRFGELYHLAPPTVNGLGYSSEEILDLFFRWDEHFPKSCQKPIRALTRTLSIAHRQEAPRLRTLVAVHHRLKTDLSEFDVPMILDEMSRWDIPQHILPDVIDISWYYYKGTPEELRRIGRTLRYWFTELDQKELSWDIVELAHAIYDETKIHLFSRVLARKEHRNQYYSTEAIQTSARLAENDKEFTQLLALTQKIDDEKEGFAEEDMENLAALTRLLVDTTWRDDLRVTFLNNEISGVLDVAETVAVLDKRKIAVPLPVMQEQVTTDWIQYFPENFSESLRRLASLTSRAEQIAVRKLHTLVFAPESIRSEIRLLERRLVDFPDNSANDRIRKRIGNLRERMITQPAQQPTESRLRQLHKKLDRRIRQIFFEQLRRSSSELLEQKLCKELDLETFPETWHKSLNRKIVLGILSLDKPVVKRLGIRLLRSIAGVAPWNYRDEPKNVKFVEKLTGQGIQLKPWLTPDPPVKIVSAAGQPLMLGFETDPMEIMKMGAPFGTCLSPWDFNFFSTIANTLDINKRVLYGRDMKGAIQARCLIALTDGGELLAFHPYAHDKEFGFREIVTEFLTRLAKRMNTLVIDNGTVSKLVSPEWYDDGSIAMSDVLTFLKDGTEFRKKLETLEPGRLLAELEKELAPHPLRSFVLPPMLDLPEIERRPELARPLIPLVTSALSSDHLVKMIQLLVQSDDMSAERSRGDRKREAKQLTKQYLLPRLEKLFFDYHWHWKTLIGELAPIVPDVLLPHVRRIGGRGTKKLETHQTESRRELLVLLYETLGRKRKAKDVD